MPQVEMPMPLHIRRIDRYIVELGLVEDGTDLGRLAIDPPGPFTSREWVTFTETYTVGELPIEPGGGFLLGVAGTGQEGRAQHADPKAPAFVTARASRPGVTLEPIKVGWNGVHSSIASVVDLPGFRVAGGTLEPGDTVTFTYGDTSQGSKGFQVPTFSSDRWLLPIYVDVDGSQNFFGLHWPTVEIVGRPEIAAGAIARPIRRQARRGLLGHGEERGRRHQPRQRPDAGVRDPARREGRRSDRGRQDAARDRRRSPYRRDRRFPSRGPSADGKPRHAATRCASRRSPPSSCCGATPTATPASPKARARRARSSAMRPRTRASTSPRSPSTTCGWTTASGGCCKSSRANTPSPASFAGILGYEWTAFTNRGGHHNVFFRDLGSERVGMQIATDCPTSTAGSTAATGPRTCSSFRTRTAPATGARATRARAAGRDATRCTAASSGSPTAICRTASSSASWRRRRSHGQAGVGPAADLERGAAGRPRRGAARPRRRATRSSPRCATCAPTRPRASACCSTPRSTATRWARASPPPTAARSVSASPAPRRSTASTWSATAR